MSLIVSPCAAVLAGLRELDYRRAKYNPKRLGEVVYEHITGERVVVVEAVKLLRGETPTGDTFYFDRLQERLKGISNLTDLILPGGGTLPVPEWFKHWCADRDIRLQIVTHDTADEVLRRISAGQRSDEVSLADEIS